jgi:hypothetical protein
VPKAFLQILACLSLTGCAGWTSDERLFGTGDWAHLGLNGAYQLEFVGNDTKQHTILTTRADGLIESSDSGITDDPTQWSLIGLVPITAGSGNFFLMVNRSDPTAERDNYFIAQLYDGKSLAFYMPDCRGTPATDGMTKESNLQPAEPGEVYEIGTDPPPQTTVAAAHEAEPASAPREPGNEVCKFTTKEALMKAGLEAERFLSMDHIVATAPMVTLSPDDPNDNIN